MINTHNCPIKLSLAIYTIFVVFSLDAMENDTSVRDITKIGLLGNARFMSLEIIKENKEDVAACFTQIPSDNIDINNLIFIKEKPNVEPTACCLGISGRVAAVKITSTGNLLFGCADGRIGFYIKNTNEGNVFFKSASSKIIALQDGVVIKDNNKKLYKAIAAVDKNGVLLCINDDNNFRELDLLKDVPGDSGVSDLLKAATSSAQGVFDISDHLKTAVREIVAADIQPYSICPEAAPFVAYIIRYVIPNLSIVLHSKDVYVYNPILKKILTFGHQDKISDICFLPNHILCTASNNKTIALFDVFRGEKLYTIPIPGESVVCQTSNLNTSFMDGEIKIISCIPSPCGKYIATISDSCHLNVWDIITGSHIYNKKLYNIPCSCHTVGSKIAFSPDSASVYVFSSDSQKIYNIKDSIKNVELSDQEHRNAIQMFMHHRGKKEISILHTLIKRELGLNKKYKGYV